MAEAVVSFAIERIGDLLIEEAKFLHGVEEQVTELQTELIRMQCFLEDVDAIRDKNKRLRNWIAEITQLAYRSEIVLDTFLLKVESMRRRGGFPGFVRKFGCFFNKLITLHKVGSEIESITNKLNNFSTRFQIYGMSDLRTRGEASSSTSRYEKLLMRRRTYLDVIEDDFVDLPEVTNELVADLVRQEKQYRAISICGVGGLGKTTLAKNIYNHKDIRNHFDAFAWACVSQQPKRNEILRSIFKELMRGENPPEEESDLIKKLLEIQATKKCLVVLDDLWSTGDWDIVKAAFPQRNEIGSIVLLTTRSKELVKHIDPLGLLNEPPLMSADQSWDLFRKKAFPRVGDTESIITKVQDLGRNMLKHCGGLPLAIVVLGGILARKHTPDEWMTVYKNIDLYLRGDNVFVEETKGVIEILSLSYYDLPYWLKPCFLYLANYPEDCEILAPALYQLWIAEGFISLDEERREKEETLMNVAERYLAELAQRSMVQLIKVEGFAYIRFGKFRSCRLHDLMRQMCLSMAKEENFLKVVDHGQSDEQNCSSFNSSVATSLSTPTSKIHRLAIHGTSNFCIDQEENIRSVLFFDGKKCTRPCRDKFVSRLPKNFKLVKVMHLEQFGSSKEERVELPKAVGDLIHLRYLSLTFGKFKLPSSIGNLRYLQTLNLHSIFTIIIPNVLWKLKQLRHLYLPWGGGGNAAKYHKLRLAGLDNLELLDNFDSRYCIVEDLQKLINLRILTGVEIWKRQDLVAFVSYLVSIAQKQLLLRHCALEIHEIDFCTEDDLALLKQIFFECQPLHDLMIRGRISELPEYQRGFHSSLTSLFLSGAKLKEDPMAMLEKLPNLAALQFFNAYIGKKNGLLSSRFSSSKTAIPDAAGALGRLEGG